MPFIPFELERWQSKWEHVVRFNLAESGVHPFTVAELLEITGTDPAELGAQPLLYSQSNGTPELRSAIAALYPGATPDNVLVTVGGSEANFVTCWSLVGPGDRVTVEVPNYLQTWGIVSNLGGDVTTFDLRSDRDWDIDPEEVVAEIRAGTKLVVVTNPNNPTGRSMTPTSRATIVDRAREVGAWLMVDEVYRGAERDGETTESFWGTYDRLVVTGGMSKAYRLPGLRIGWIVGPADFIEAAWARHDYTVIGPNALSDFLATRALGARDRILESTRRVLRGNWHTLDNWLGSFGDLFDWRAPDAGAICLVAYRLGMESPDLVEHFRKDHDILLVPGTHVGLSNHLRLGFGNEPGEFQAALEVLGRGFRALAGD